MVLKANPKENHKFDGDLFFVFKCAKLRGSCVPQAFEGSNLKKDEPQ